MTPAMAFYGTLWRVSKSKNPGKTWVSEGFKKLFFALEIRCSIQLSYGTPCGKTNVLPRFLAIPKDLASIAFYA